jgi:hypothetical protein
LNEIAEAFAELGQFPRALQTAERIAKARVREKALVAIAVAQAKAGEVSAALQTALRIEHEPALRDSALREVALGQAACGDVAAAVDTVQRLRHQSDRAKVLADIAMTLARAGATERTKAVLGGVRSTDGLLDDALGSVALAQAAVGELGSALETAQKVGLRREEVLKQLAHIQTGTGFGTHVVKKAEAILADRNGRVPELAAALVEAGDKEHFKRLLIPCAYYLDSAYRMCGLLGRLYPEQAAAVAAVTASMGNEVAVESAG